MFYAVLIVIVAFSLFGVIRNNVKPRCLRYALNGVVLYIMAWSMIIAVVYSETNGDITPIEFLCQTWLSPICGK